MLLIKQALFCCGLREILIWSDLFTVSEATESSILTQWWGLLFCSTFSLHFAETADFQQLSLHMCIRFVICIMCTITAAYTLFPILELRCWNSFVQLIWLLDLSIKWVCLARAKSMLRPSDDICRMKITRVHATVYTEMSCQVHDVIECCVLTTLEGLL